MAECKDIDRALAQLGRKIDEQYRCCQENKRAIADLNSRLGRLERGGNRNNQQNNPQDLTAIYQRLSKIESYITALDGTGASIKKGLDDIKKIFLGG